MASSSPLPLSPHAARRRSAPKADRSSTAASPRKTSVGTSAQKPSTYPANDSAQTRDVHPFVVLLGPDYTGKSSFLSSLREDPIWRPVSYDDDFLDETFVILKHLKQDFFQALRQGCRFSDDFLLSGFQLPILYLRDQAARQRKRGPVLVDSYFYKILAKCHLKGLVHPQIFNFWRSFPRPDSILFLDTDPEAQWHRAEQSGRLNPFEYYGDHPTRDGFLTFQRDLSQRMLEETQGIPVEAIDSESTLDSTRKLLRRSLNRITRAESGFSQTPVGAPKSLHPRKSTPSRAAFEGAVL